jgi:hypothetical protein
MKIFLLFISLTSLCFAAQDSATVRFVNGDKISGNAVALNLETLTWESEILNEQANFKLDQILDLTLPAEIDSKFNDDVSHQALLELTNGDSVKGLLIGLNDEEIRLNTWYAGEMVFRRLNVKSISISKGAKVLYRGPNDIDEWVVSENPESWIVSDGELTSSEMGSAARNMEFSGENEISFDISWRGSLQSKVILFSSDLTTANPKSGYEITFQGSSLQMRRLKDGNSIWLSSKVRARRMPPNEKAKIDIRFSQRTNRIMVFLDDQLYGLWDKIEIDEMQAKGLHFVSMQNSDIGISNIVVSNWDGNMDISITDEPQAGIQRFQGNIQIQGNVQFRGGREIVTPEPKELPEGRMMLSNGDTFEGEVLGIDGDMIKIKTPFTEVVFPIFRINNIALKKAELETPKRYNGDVRAVLADGSKLVFRLEDVKDGNIIGFSQNFGRSEFKLSAFKRIEFNIHWSDK